MGIDDTDMQQQDDDGGLQDVLGTSGETEFVTEGDPKPAGPNRGMLLVLLVVGLGAVVYFMYFKKGPDLAAGAVAPADSAHETITSFLSDNGQNIKSMEQMLKNTQKVVQQFNNYPSMTQVPVNELHTNPFRFEQATPAETGEDPAAVAKREREKAKAEAMAAAQKMQLQSVMAGGARRTCMIGGAMYTEGQTAEGFLIEKITPTGVIIRQGPFLFQKPMAR